MFDGLKLDMISTVRTSEPLLQQLFPSSSTTNTWSHENTLVLPTLNSRRPLAEEKPREECNKWFEISCVRDPSLFKTELESINLKSYVLNKSSYNTSFEKLPEKFQVGRVIEGGLRPVGGGAESTASQGRRRKKGASTLGELMKSCGDESWKNPDVPIRQKRRKIKQR